MSDSSSLQLPRPDADLAWDQPIVFIDFDGVTHPDFHAGASFECLPRIEAVLRRFPLVPLVLSTSWRESHPMDELREIFSADVGSRLLGGTPYLTHMSRENYPVPLSEFYRQAEVEAWLHENRTIHHPWVAIDDRPWWFDPDCPHVLTTDRKIGFTWADAERLQEMLQERLP